MAEEFHKKLHLKMFDWAVITPDDFVNETYLVHINNSKYWFKRIDSKAITPVSYHLQQNNNSFHS